MKTLTAFFCLLFVASGVLADPYSAAIRQAKNVAANASNTRQDNDNPPPPAQPPPASPSQNNTPPDPVLEATRQNIAALRVDFDAFGDRADTNSAAAQKPSLMSNLTAAASGTKPSPASVSKLAHDVHAIFNSSHLSPAQQQKIFADVQTLLQNGGVSPDNATNIVNDIKTIATETK